MTLAEALAGVGAILTALGGIFLIVRELNRRERKAANRQIDSLSKQIDVLRRDFLAYHGWAFDLARRLTGRGMEVPPAPELHPLEPEADTENQRRWFWRRRRDEP